MKERFLTHDLGSRNDPKLIRLQMEMGGQGLGIWWCLVEMLWEQGGYLPLDSAAIAFSLHWAKPDEVQAVIFNYNLFDNDGERFWSPGALERIAAQNAIYDAKVRAGRRSGEVRRNQSNGVRNGVQQSGEQCLNGVPENAEQLNNKINNKINNYISGPLSADETKRILEIFFFDLNFTDPAAEVQRFVDHYSARGWVFGDGTQIVDRIMAARKWTPEDKKKNRLPKQFLGWFKAVYISASENPGLQMSVLSDLAAGDMKGDQIVMTFRTREIAQEFREFVGKNFGNKYNIDWRLRNG